MGVDCKFTGNTYVGSNPTRPILRNLLKIEPPIRVPSKTDVNENKTYGIAHA